MRSPLLALIPLLLAPIAGCGPAEDQAAAQTARAPAGGARARGTIHATLDGAARTWYVVEGRVSAKPYSSAMWMEGRTGRLVSLGGYDTEHPPIETFSWDVESGAVSFGSYRGSTVQIMLSIAEGERAVRVGFPDAGGRMFSVVYLPVASDDVVTGVHLIAEGWIDVAEVSFTGGTAAVRGTFQGTLRKMDGSASVRMEDGRFEVSGIPHRDRLLEGGGGR